MKSPEHKMVAGGLLAAAFFMLANVIMFKGLFNELEMQTAAEKDYCEMVELFIDTNGEFGWPDYKTNYHRDCIL